MMKKFQNIFYTCDNLFVLNGMNSESVDLIYSDPPFNSKRLYSASVGSKAAGASFKDMWTWQDVDAHYLERLVGDYPALVGFIRSVGETHGKAMMSYAAYMAQRIVEMRRVLKPSGSVYLHCDPTASHYLKIVMDGIFGRENFRNEIIWRIGWVSGYKTRKKGWIRNHDVILYYVKSRDAEKFFNKEYLPHPPGYLRRDGKPPRGEGFPIEDTWNCHDADRLDSIMIKSFSREKTGYPTQKPMALLRRIIKASSNKGDVVLDPFCGCATTCVVAEELGRNWIGIDIEEKSVEVLRDRLHDAEGIKIGGGERHIHSVIPPQRTDVAREPPDNKGVKRRLFEKQEGACNGCFKNFDLVNLETDRIVPSSKGGGDYFANYQLLCGNCNRIKGDRPMEYLRRKIAERSEHLNSRLTFGA